MIEKPSMKLIVMMRAFFNAFWYSSRSGYQPAEYSDHQRNAETSGGRNADQYAPAFFSML